MFQNARIIQQNTQSSYSRCLPSLVMDLALPAYTVLSHADVKDFSLIQHLMMKAKDTLVLYVWSDWGLRWGHGDVWDSDFGCLLVI